MTLYEVFAREECSVLDLRAIVRAAMVARYGAVDGAMAAFARDLAPRWGISPDSARSRLSRWFAEGRTRRDMTTDDFAVMLDVLGLDVVPCMRAAE